MSDAERDRRLARLRAAKNALGRELMERFDAHGVGVGIPDGEAEPAILLYLEPGGGTEVPSEVEHDDGEGPARLPLRVVERERTRRE